MNACEQIEKRTGPLARAALTLVLAFAAGAAGAQPAASASAPAPTASSALAAKAAFEHTQRAQQEDARRQLRAEQQAQASQEAAQAQRRQQLCDAKKRLHEEALQSPESTPDRPGLIQRAQAAMELACAKPLAPR